MYTSRLRLSGLALVLTTAPVAAQPVEPGREGELAHIVTPVPGARACFTRTYDAHHLQRHPRQRFTALLMELRYHRHDPSRDEPRGQRNYYFSLLARVKGEPRRLLASGECVPQGPNISCGLDCDGGGFGLSRGRNGAVLLDMTTFGRLRMTRGCSDEENAVVLTPGADDKRFRLDPADLKSCRSLR